jgi:hypothetical protein
VPSLEILDETVIVVRREVLASVVADRTRWVAWWPGLEATVVVDRGVEGMRWSVTGSLVGTSELALVEQADGVLVRYVLTAEPTEPGSRTQPRRLPDSPHGRRELDALRRRHILAWKATVWALEDEFEAGA